MPGAFCYPDLVGVVVGTGLRWGRQVSVAMRLVFAFSLISIIGCFGGETAPTPKQSARELAQEHVSQGNSDLFGIVGPELLWATQIYSEDYCEQAFEHYGEALRLDPDFYPAYYSRAYAYMRSRRYSLAMQDLTKIIDLEPGKIALNLAYRERARAYVLLGMQREAESDWEKQAQLVAETASETLEEYITFEGQFPVAFLCIESGDPLREPVKRDVPLTLQP